MDERLYLFANAAVTFLAIELLAVFAGFKLLQRGMAQYLPPTAAILGFVIGFTIVTALILMLLKFKKHRGTFFTVIFGLAIFMGTQTILALFLSELYATLIAFAVVVARLYSSNILLHNTAMVLGISGISAELGLVVSVTAIIVLLILLSIYDVIAVFKTKHMLRMVEGLVESKMPLLLMVPKNIRHLGKSVDFRGLARAKMKKKPKKTKKPVVEFMFLGAGDVALPSLFAVSALQYGLTAALSVAFGTLAGLAAVVYIAHKEGKAIPALPPIAIASIASFGLSFLL